MLQAWVIRTLRARAERMAVKAGKDIPTVSLQEMLSAFDGMSISMDGVGTELTRLLREE